MGTVSTAGHEHHERISAVVDRLPELAGLLDRQPRPSEFDTRHAALCAFARETLMPHMQAVEATLYPQLDRLMQRRHSMLQMRREHQDLLAILGRLQEFREAIEADALGPAGTIQLRRILYRLYALLKVHLAEEEEYMRVLDRGLSEAEQAELAARLEHAAAEPM